MKLLDTHEEFKSLVELKSFSEAQTKTLIELQNKFELAKKENAHLKELLKSTAPLLPKSAHIIVVEDEETIAKMEISKLRDVSIERALTYEETKKLEVYFKILQAIRAAPKTLDQPSRTMSSEELAAIAEGSSSESI
jgi:cell shape-determining protein MreC